MATPTAEATAPVQTPAVATLIKTHRSLQSQWSELNSSSLRSLQSFSGLLIDLAIGDLPALDQANTRMKEALGEHQAILEKMYELTSPFYDYLHRHPESPLTEAPGAVYPYYSAYLSILQTLNQCYENEFITKEITVNSMSKHMTNRLNIPISSDFSSFPPLPPALVSELRSFEFLWGLQPALDEEIMNRAAENIKFLESCEQQDNPMSPAKTPKSKKKAPASEASAAKSANKTSGKKKK